MPPARPRGRGRDVFGPARARGPAHGPASGPGAAAEKSRGERETRAPGGGPGGRHRRGAPGSAAVLGVGRVTAAVERLEGKCSRG
ncbi:hypothetical protein BKA00_003472 [Actinomadura coerulea]|uniref:Uncharacterized protein n=1 Tax=Actinomadura coerulea TaxID=46159 RepID=A0A7X0KZK1_9ACTN|nr:hypothetical protein [Actinomadura coerulea]